MESQPKLSDLRNRRKHLYRSGDEEVKLQAYEGDRSVRIERNLKDYKAIIPPFPEGWEMSDTSEARKDFIKLVDERFERAVRDNKQLRILDVGCGQATALLDIYFRMAQDYSPEIATNHLQLVGLSLTHLEDQVGLNGKEPKYDQSQREEAHLNYIMGDMRFLRERLQRRNFDQFDIITSVRALEYLYPLRITQEVVKQIYRSLAADGVAALVHANFLSGSFNTDPQDPRRTFSEKVKVTNAAMKEHGNHIAFVPQRLGNQDYVDIVMHKNDKSFFMPLSYNESGN